MSEAGLPLTLNGRWAGIGRLLTAVPDPRHPCMFLNHIRVSELFGTCRTWKAFVALVGFVEDDLPLSGRAQSKSVLAVLAYPLRAFLQDVPRSWHPGNAIPHCPWTAGRNDVTFLAGEVCSEDGVDQIRAIHPSTNRLLDLLQSIPRNPESFVVMLPHDGLSRSGAAQRPMTLYGWDRIFGWWRRLDASQ